MKLRRLHMPRLDPRWWMLGVAILAGGIAAWAAQHHLRTVAARLEASARQPMQAVVVAAFDLVAGTSLDTHVVAVRDVPTEWLPADAVLPEHFETVLGSVLRQPVRRGDPLLNGYLERPVTHQRFSSQLAAGRRAVTIPVDEISSLSGMLEPGDLIDLYVSFQHEQRRVTAPLLEGVRVLATGHQRGEHESGESYGRGYATVTLDASPEDAVRLVAARQQGSISAMLRHGGDMRPAAARTSGDLATLLGILPQTPKRPPAIPVIFGDRGPRAIPGLNDAEAAARMEEDSAVMPRNAIQETADGMRTAIQAEAGGTMPEPPDATVVTGRRP